MKVTDDKRSEWRRRATMDQSAGLGLGWPGVVLALLNALDASESEGWASYAAEQERHAETTARLVAGKTGADDA